MNAVNMRMRQLAVRFLIVNGNYKSRLAVAM